MRRALSAGLLLAIVAAACGRSGSPGGVGAFVPTPTVPIVDASPSPTAVVPEDFGNGADGVATFTTGSNAINQCDRVLSASDAGGVTIDSFSLPINKRVLLIQSQDDVAGASGDTTDVVDPSLGHFEFARIANYSSFVGDGVVTFSAPLLNEYSTATGRSAQICTVDEYEALTISGTASLVPQAAFGATIARHGVVAVFVNDTLTIDGGSLIVADGFGSEGGARSDAGGNDVDLDDTSTAGGGGKGLGVDRESPPPCCGRGSIANAAGGGNGRSGGGGGGGNAGRGGFGGDVLAGGAVDGRGRGGGAVLYVDSSMHAVHGGGGGGGHNETATNAGVGGNGGGLVFIFARNLAGAGKISANGADGGATTGTTGGGGGGGGGGTIVLAVEDASAFIGSIEAFGGAGGSVTGSTIGSLRGPGGGGGGGRIYVRGMSPPPLAAVRGGLGGGNVGAGGAAHGATGGAPGHLGEF